MAAQPNPPQGVNGPIRLGEYVPYPFLIPTIELDFIVEDDVVRVSSCMRVEPRSAVSVPMLLKGNDLELESISVDGNRLNGDNFKLSSSELVLHQPPAQPFELRIDCRIDPFSNTSLEGLYSSGGMLTTQCEAEGFRRISFHPDRPDVLSRYRVRIEADQSHYPVLLSNGNQISSGLTDHSPARHEAIWDDPYPKPSYLFALVAGVLEEVQDSFIRKSGRSVLLRLHVESGDQPYTAHAMASLKRAMAWDEEVYGLEYDLDEYNIVAVRHFNMGAMENKSLNIFNSKLVLADTESTTDAELERIESVVAHEYFHNWTGNRITCRDWFQLSLKEGLTVFRDQSFTADLHSQAVKRIEDVSMLRNTQFREDSGPTAHPVKPSEYYAIDNFYTTTIYEKGAELIRMLHTLLGHQRFMAGMAVYVERFDGTAATTEEFVSAIADGACLNGEELGFDRHQFERWYHQAGTPQVSIKRYWDSKLGTLSLQVSQSTPATPGQPDKQPLVIPLAIAVIGEEGRVIKDQLLVLDRVEENISITDLPLASNPPALSLFRGFSAPVTWQMDVSLEESLHLLKFDDDPVARWESGQVVWRKVLLARAAQVPNQDIEQRLLLALAELIESEGDPSLLATLLSMPGLAELESAQDLADPLGLYEAFQSLKLLLGTSLQSVLQDLLDRSRSAWSANWPLGQGERSLTALAWGWLAAAGDIDVRLEALKAVDGPSMTLARAAMRALQAVDCPERDKALSNFYDRWKDRPVILDAWFALEASTPRANGLERVSQLLAHPRFDPMAPNAVRAVLGGFAGNTPVFHAVDGSGYCFMADQLIAVDQRNPITASRMVKVFSRWRSYAPSRRDAMVGAIERLASAELSSNTREVVNLIQD
ncbi:MAG: aminopeptidase N [Prochlorococcaceae cyanobacterium ETNP18_MAG_1]|nr:aminopeptidase N [Prochlorococcaceae cyanobacterium ETNP18_MAG_1]